MEKVRLVYKKCGIHGKNTPRDKTLVISSPLLNIEGEFEVMLSGDVFFFNTLELRSLPKLE